MQVLIPAYQPTALLPHLVASLIAARPSCEVLVVDDGSDASCQPHFTACEGEGARVLRLPVNRGKGHALRAGFTHLLETRATGPVVTADADGQHTVRDVLAVADAVDQSVDGPAHLVLGQRQLDTAVPLRSRVGNSATRLLFRAATGRALHDTQTGLRAFPTSLLPWLVGLRGERYEYELAMLLQAARHRVDMRCQPIATIYLDDNTSSHFRPVADSIRVYAPFLAFIGTSLTAFAMDTVALLMLSALGLGLLPAVVLARLLSATTNYSLNRRLVFPGGDPDGHRGFSAGRYAALAGTLLASNFLLLVGLSTAGLPLLPAKLLTEVLLVACSYVVQARLVFTYRRGTATMTRSAPAARYDRRS